MPGLLASMVAAGATAAGATAAGAGAAPGSDSPPVPWLGLRLPPRTTQAVTDTAIHTATAVMPTAMMTTTRLPQLSATRSPRLTATAMHRWFLTAMATHRAGFTGATLLTERMGPDIAPTACPGSDIADIVPVSSERGTAERCMELTCGTVR